MQPRKKGMRRAYLKRFSADRTSAPTGPTMGWSSEYHQRARAELPEADLQQLWQGGWRQGLDRFYKVDLTGQICMYFCGSIFFFVKDGVRSITYGSRSQAMTFFWGNRITWVEEFQSA
jgi:hypothetical protein